MAGRLDRDPNAGDASILEGPSVRFPSPMISRPPGSKAGFLLLAAAIAFQAVFLAPELRIERVPVNDSAFHLAASERLGQSLARHEPFLDPWVSEWSLGYPVWRSYQPLPHLIAAGFLWIARPVLHPAAAFGLLQYLLLVLLPVSAYAAARLFGLGPVGAGLAAVLILAPSGAGEFGHFGLQYGAFVWRGSGLFTQLVAVHFFLLALGSAARALESGRGRSLAGALLAATALSHIVFGYAVALSAVVLAVSGPRPWRPRFARLLAIALRAILLTAWFVVPLFLLRSEINHSRWEPAYKWDSFGASSILRELGSGRLLDAGRLPALSLFLLFGVLLAAVFLREPPARRLLALALGWLALFFGRATWGRLVVLLGVPADLPMHRFQAVFECFAVLLAAWGLEKGLRIAGRRRGLRPVAIALVAAGLAVILIDRAGYLRDNGRWGDRNLEAYERELPDLRAAMARIHEIVSERPGRVSAGKASEWGSTFKVGDAPVYSVLTAEHFDQVSFLYHAMSRTSDVMVLRDETNPTHDAIFGIRSVIAPATWPAPAFLKPRGVFGRFAVYEASPSGYFSLVDIAARSRVARAKEHDLDARWLTMPWAAVGLVSAFDSSDAGLPDLGLDAPPPPVPVGDLKPRGEVLDEVHQGGTFRARVHALRDCAALVKITWDPGLAATVDGRSVPLQRVTPGFGAVALSPGNHEIQVRYRPGPLRPILFFLGLAAFVAVSLSAKSADLPSAGEAKPVEPRAGGKRVEVAAAAVLAVAAAAAIWVGHARNTVSSASAGASPAGSVEASMQEGLSALRDRRDPEAAVRAFREVLRLDPEHYGATFQLARALDEAGRPEEARPLWVKMFSLAEAAKDADTLKLVRERLARPDLPSADSLMKSGLDALYTRHDPAAAAEDFRKVLRINPDHYGATYQLASALDQLGRSGEALPLWKTVLAMAERFGDAATAATARERIAAGTK
ncbi:MAG: tetratricopeptide repeat protein [Thermoanaerobaculia bacterium]